MSHGTTFARAVSGALLFVATLAACVEAAPTVSVVIDAEQGHPLDLGWGIALDASGNLIVAGHDSDTVLQRTPAGVVSVLLGPAGDGVHALDGPTSVAVGADGSLYVLAVNSRNVFRKPPGMPWVQILDETGDGAGHTLATGPWHIALDGDGNAFVSSGGPDYAFVLKLTPGGSVSVVLDETGDGAGHLFDSPAGMVTDAAGNLYVAGGGTDNIFQVTPAGTITQIYESSPATPCDSPRNFVIEPDGTLYFTCGGFDYEVYRRDPAGTLTEMSQFFYAELAAQGPNDTLLVSSSHEVLGLRKNGAPRCRILDVTGNGELPLDLNYGAVTTPDGVVYANGRNKVYRIDGACGPARDVAGSWRVTRKALDPEDPPTVTTQTWTQAGFDVTVSESSGATYTGTVDDAGKFDIDDDAPSCVDLPPVVCCPSASTILGTVSADGIRWNGFYYPIAFTYRGCGSFFPYETTAVRLCDDGNAVDGDGCDSTGNIEACWTCDGSTPSVCSANVRTCDSGGGGGASLRASSRPRFSWKLPNGPASTIDALGDPLAETDYSVCVFDRSTAEPSVLLSARAPAGSGWKAITDGFSLKARDEDAPFGITKITVKSGSRTRATVRGAGANLASLALPVPLPLTVQLGASDGACFEATYSPAGVGTNDGESVKLEADPLP